MWSHNHTIGGKVLRTIPLATKSKFGMVQLMRSHNRTLEGKVQLIRCDACTSLLTKYKFGKVQLMTLQLECKLCGLSHSIFVFYLDATTFLHFLLTMQQIGMIKWSLWILIKLRGQLKKHLVIEQTRWLITCAFCSTQPHVKTDFH